MATYPIAHLDADCFYVSAERVRNRELRGIPVAVLGNQGACVIARSYEMKALGVGVGNPIWEVLPLCPDGVYVKRDFRLYELLSRMMLTVAREFSPRVEYYSIDEFFMEFRPARGKTLEETAVAIQNEILERIGVPVTIGVARTRTLAKLISDTAKPFGAKVVLDPDGERDLLGGLAVNEITGIAGRRARRLEPWGVKTCLDFAQMDRRLVRELLTASGETLWWELNGDPVTPLKPNRPLHKTLSRGGSLGESSSDPTVLYAWLVRNIERLVEELEFHEVVAVSLVVWVGYRDGRAGVGRSVLTAPSDRFEALLEVARPCLRKAWIPHASASRMHLIADRLSPRSPIQLGLFDPPTSRVESIAKLKREINERVGRFAIRSAATLPLAGIYRDGANSYDICDVRGKMCF